jgi:hypothetical protein
MLRRPRPVAKSKQLAVKKFREKPKYDVVRLRLTLKDSDRFLMNHFFFKSGKRFIFFEEVLNEFLLFVTGVVFNKLWKQRP